jgi:hypothetical protein
MKKTLFVAILSLITSTNILAAKTTHIDAMAQDIAAKTVNLKPNVLKLALEAFYQAKNNGVKIKKPVLTVIDYTLASTKKRLWVVDVESRKILHTSLLAHGKYSGENHTTKVSNILGSKQTSVGLFLTAETYFGRDGYSLRIDGLEKGFNDLARKRTIVMHGAPYVSEKFAKATGRIGRSWGCPAVQKELAKPIIDTVKNGSLIFAYHNHQQWLNKSEFIKA